MAESIQTPVQKENYRNVQIDAVGVSIANIASPFLPVFLTRLGASNFQIGLLSAMPGVAGLLLAIFIGGFLQTRRNIVPWFSAARLAYIACYALTGLMTLILPREYAITATLFVWAIATIPQIALAVSFSVVMNAVAGPEGRYSLLSRRWAIFGFTSVVGTFLVTRVIDQVEFPRNYEFMFLGLSLGGLISFYFSNKLQIPNQSAAPLATGRTLRETISNYAELLKTNPKFADFSYKRFVYLSAIALGQPILPVFFVHRVRATDSQIGTITMIMTLVMLVGYLIWPPLSRRYGGRFVLLATTLGMTFYPALTAAFPSVELIYVFAGVAGLFQAGLDLVFFDELMKTVPPEYSATFVSLAQSMQYLSAMIAPIVGTILADTIGLESALWISTALRFIGFLLFLGNPFLKPVKI